MRVGVFLASGFSFQRFANGGGCFDQALVDDVGGRAGAGVAGVGELDDPRGRDDGEGGEVEQALGALDLASPRERARRV